MDDVLIDPTLPARFDDTPNENRPDSHAKWWGFPFVVTSSVEEWDAMFDTRTDEHVDAGRKHWADTRSKWMEAWPSGTRYETRCLDGGAWDRSNLLGHVCHHCRSGGVREVSTSVEPETVNPLTLGNGSDGRTRRDTSRSCAHSPWIKALQDDKNEIFKAAHDAAAAADYLNALGRSNEAEGADVSGAVDQPSTYVERLESEQREASNLRR